MEEYEKEAYHALAKTKAKAKVAAKAKGKAGAKSKAKAKSEAKAASKPGPKVKAKAKGHNKQVKPSAGKAASSGYYGPPPSSDGPFGCIRCRGNIKGCSQCVQPGYAGLRFLSRQDWSKWHQANQANK